MIVTAYDDHEDGGQIELLYVSESHILISSFAASPSGDGPFTPNTVFENWSTAVDTRSLSFNSFNETLTENSTISARTVSHTKTRHRNVRLYKCLWPVPAPG